MEWVRKVAAALLSLVLMFAFVQIVGGYLIGQLSQNTGQVLEPQTEEKVVKQMVLQLEPMEYYTVQVGSYQEASAGQARINALAQMGYRVCVSQGPPFALWLGCMGKEPQLSDLPEAVRNSSSDIFVQKKILNETALRFSAADSQVMEQAAALLSSYDVVLKHSLQMFQDYRYEACSEENWTNMIEQIAEELTMIQETAGALLNDEASEPVASGILNLLAVTEEYGESLQLMQEKKSDQVVLLAQSCLLELIEQYHGFMTENSDKINL